MLLHDRGGRTFASDTERWLADIRRYLRVDFWRSHHPDDCEKVNPNGGAIALGHPLGMSGARLVLTAARQLQRIKGRYALASMCIGVGQGIASLLAQP